MRIGCMFSGQGAQVPGMGKDLWEQYPEARGVFEKADAVLGYSLSSLCFEGSLADLTACAVCQPATYVMSHACLAAFRSVYGGEVESVVCGGLSLGEISALSAAGCCSFEDGLELVAERGKLMDEACRESEGGMAAVLGADLAMVEGVCEETDVDVANLNCPGQIVISGKKEHLSDAVGQLKERGVNVVVLNVAGAYHSRLMSDASRRFGEVLRRKRFEVPRIGFVQNVKGDFEEDVESIRRNLELQICHRVCWESCVRVMMTRCEMLLEFGPGAVLAGFMKRIDRQFPVMAVNSVSQLLAFKSKLTN